eukprot:1038950-Prymnesium_polylepis.1
MGSGSRSKVGMRVGGGAGGFVCMMLECGLVFGACTCRERAIGAQPTRTLYADGLAVPVADSVKSSNEKSRAEKIV